MKPSFKNFLRGIVVGIALAAVGVVFADRNGSGTYSLPAGNPVNTGTAISSNWANSTLSDIALALTNSLAKDGQTTPTANLPMGGFKHTGVANASAANQYAAAGQIQNDSLKVLSSVANTNGITGNLTPAIGSYTTNMVVYFIPIGNNTSTVTLAINGLPARPVVKLGGVALAANDLVAGYPAMVVASSTQFVLLNPMTQLTASQALALILTVDGSGSGLDAGLLEGQDGAYYRNASNLNAGSIPSARVPQAAVTQHQAALSISTSQLTGNMPNARIIQSNVTQHQAALSISASQISNGTTGSGSVVMSASPTLSGTITGGTFSGTHSGNGASLTSLNASNLSSGTVASARISSASVTQHMGDGYARNITGKVGTTKNLVPNASCPPSVSGEDGRITYCY